MMETRQSQQLFFDPDQHPEDTLQAFEEFTQLFELRYDAQFPDPPKVSMDAAIDRWKVANTTENNQNPRPDLATYDAIRNDWRSKDKVAKFLACFHQAVCIQTGAQSNLTTRNGKHLNGMNLWRPCDYTISIQRM